MKKLANKLKKIDLNLPKWTRDILYEHILDVCTGLKTQSEKKINQEKEKAQI
jgi:hypothetical protein